MFLWLHEFFTLNYVLFYHEIILPLCTLQVLLWCAPSCSSTINWNLWLIYPGDKWPINFSIPLLMTSLLLSSKCQCYIGYLFSGMVSLMLILFDICFNHKLIYTICSNIICDCCCSCVNTQISFSWSTYTRDGYTLWTKNV